MSTSTEAAHTKRPGITEHQAAVENAASLRTEIAQVSQQIQHAPLTGDDASRLQARRLALRSQLETAEEAVETLRPFADDEMDAKLLAELDAAIGRQAIINEQIVEQTARVKGAERALDDATAELMRLRYRTSGGVFEAQQRLNRHRRQHPIGGETQ
ncbi:MAG: hypothetical protein WB438_03670 [Candidatus Cybelea sp.]